jgi:membrane protein
MSPPPAEQPVASSGSPLKPPLRFAWQFIRNFFRRVIAHGCSEIAGEMAFDFLFAIFPAALFTATLIVFFNIPSETVFKSFDLVGLFLHDELRKMIQDNIESLITTTQNSGQILTFGLIGAIWVGSSAISATIKALNRAYGVTETRSFVRLRLLSLELMFGAGFSMFLAFNLLIMGSWIEGLLYKHLGLAHFLPSIMGAIKWPAGFLCAVFMAGMLYRSAPNCRPRIIEVLPGAALFTILWYFLSNAFGSYVGNFSYYNMITGTLWVFIVLLLWIYLTALILLMGGELNAEVVNGKYESNKSEG